MNATKVLFSVSLVLVFSLPRSVSFGKDPVFPTPVVCDPVETPKNTSADCRYVEQGSLWTPPHEAEWSRNREGNRSGFINIYFHGSLEVLIYDLMASGWIESLENNKVDNHQYGHSVYTYEKYRVELFLARKNRRMQRHVERLKSTGELESKMSNAELVIQAMPVSDEFLCGNLQVAAFERDNHPFSGRHHLRIWSTGQKDGRGRPVWAIAANRDVSLTFDKSHRDQLFLGHKIEHNTDLERDRIVEDLLTIDPTLSHAGTAVNFLCSPPKNGAYSKDRQIKELAPLSEPSIF